VPVLRSLSEKVSRRLKASGVAGHTVVLKLKSRDFRIRTRNRRLDDPTCLADRIFRTGLALLERELDGTKYRLLGIGVADLTNANLADPPDLVDRQATRRAIAERAIDKVRDRFGRDAVETGYTFGRQKSARPQRDGDAPDAKDGEPAGSGDT
jgi:DNA polymerase-4